MAQMRQVTRVRQEDVDLLVADVQAQVHEWGGTESRAHYLGHGYLEFSDENGETAEMVAHRCSCSQLFATWAETGELDSCPGCGANVNESL